jgi:hypothetical protein
LSSLKTNKTCGGQWLTKMGVKRHKPKPYIFSFELVMSERFPFSGFFSTAALDLGMLKCSKQFKNSFILSIKFNTFYVV